MYPVLYLGLEFANTFSTWVNALITYIPLDPVNKDNTTVYRVCVRLLLLAPAILV